MNKRYWILLICFICIQAGLAVFFVIKDAWLFDEPHSLKDTRHLYNEIEAYIYKGVTRSFTTDIEYVKLDGFDEEIYEHIQKEVETLHQTEILPSQLYEQMSVRLKAVDRNDMLMYKQNSIIELFMQAPLYTIGITYETNAEKIIEVSYYGEDEMEVKDQEKRLQAYLEYLQLDTKAVYAMDQGIVLPDIGLRISLKETLGFFLLKISPLIKSP